MREVHTLLQLKHDECVEPGRKGLASAQEAVRAKYETVVPCGKVDDAQSSAESKADAAER